MTKQRNIKSHLSEKVKCERPFFTKYSAFNLCIFIVLEFEHNGRDAGAIEEQVISNVRIEQRSYSAVVWKPEPTMMNK